ncbi:DNA-directed RNA polymerase III subunit RPC5-like isoform X2 [Tigriopus californicus]|uniref:DNA-directed RNA polymerase III subunit RPC5-like isoform X2 n=1 Tax=Tigriopus californicus TaxID=6832 RepID=UPI0027DA72EE|nr:DNA-directed RNA polymerase III subunit RPC5-like isoform X2 [Tigriopus californicus]
MRLGRVLLLETVPYGCLTIVYFCIHVSRGVVRICSSHQFAFEYCSRTSPNVEEMRTELAISWLVAVPAFAVSLSCSEKRISGMTRQDKPCLSRQCNLSTPRTLLSYQWRCSCLLHPPRPTLSIRVGSPKWRDTEPSAPLVTPSSFLLFVFLVVERQFLPFRLLSSAMTDTMATSAETLTNGQDQKPPENGNSHVDADEEDPIIHEIPVFLAKSLAQQLYLFQYPVRPAHMSYDTTTVLDSKVRPQQKQVELAMALDSKGTNYDESKGEQIAMNVDGTMGTREAEELVFPSGVMDKQLLASAKAVPNASRYAVGILGGNELHITPLEAVLQLRPNLGYLDKSDKTAKAEGRTLDDPDDPQDDKEEEVEAKPVTVRFAKSGTDYAKKQREKSFAFQQKKSEEEPWIPTRFHHVKSTQWEQESQKLFCRKMDDEIASLNQTPKQYLEALVTDPFSDEMKVKQELDP